MAAAAHFRNYADRLVAAFPDCSPGEIAATIVDGLQRNGEPVHANAEAHAESAAHAAIRASDARRKNGIAEPAWLGADVASLTIGRGLAYVDFNPSIDTPPPSWLAKGLLPRNGIGLLLGESGAGKSFAAIHAALSVAWGLPLFGAKVKQGAVLYIAAEGGKSVLRRIKPADKALEGAIAAANLCRPKGTLPLTRAPIRVVTEAPDLSREGDPLPLVNTIAKARAQFEAEGHRLALVVVDTWHAAMGGGSENDAADTGHALRPLIAESERGDFLALIVHHPGKDADRGARGSNSLPAAADVIIALGVPGFEGAKAKPSWARRQAVVTKMRDGEVGGGFSYSLDVVEIGTDDDGDPVTTCIVKPVDEPATDDDGMTTDDREFIAAVAGAIGEAKGERGNLQGARLRFYTARRVAKPHAKDDAHRTAWNRALKAAVAANRVGVDKDDTSIWMSADAA